MDELPDRARVESHRLRYLAWLAGALGCSLRGFDFDLPDEPSPTVETLPSPPYWWPKRQAATAHYLNRILRPIDPGSRVAPALPFVTVYLLALETTHGARRRDAALKRLAQTHECEHLDVGLRTIASGIRAGELAPHPTWIGKLEWDLLHAAGVRWPEYIIRCARLGDASDDALEREVGKRLSASLGAFLPTPPGGGRWTEEQLIRHAFGQWDLGSKDLRRFLLRSAAEGAVASDQPYDVRMGASIAAAGLWLLLRDAKDAQILNSDVVAFRAMAEADGGSPEAALLARRLLRARDDGTAQPSRDDFWLLVDGLSRGPPSGGTQAAASGSTPAGAANAPDGPAGNHSDAHGDNFEWILVRGEQYEFTRPMTRRVVEVLWEANGKPVHADAILRKLDHVRSGQEEAFRVDDVFRVKSGGKHPAWGKVILSEGRGTNLYRLNR